MPQYDAALARRYKAWGRAPAMGRTSVRIECPFCFRQFIAYVWSLAGSGKKCPGCGAWHGSMSAYPPEKKR